MQTMTRFNRSTRRTGLVTVITMAATVGLATTAGATTSDADDVARAIELVAPEVDVLDTDRSPDGAYAAEQGQHAVDLPATTAGVVEVRSSAGPDLSIGLPDVAAGSADAASDGTVVYEGKSVDVAIQALAQGVRIQTVLTSASAPTRFDYSLGDVIPVISENGSVVIATEEGLALVESPWAFDANGKAVPTHYEVNGSTLTQVVDHASESISYPVVADPTWITGTNAFFGGAFGAVRFNRTETNQIAAGAGAAAAALFIAQKFAAYAGAAAVGAVTAAEVTAAAVMSWALGAVAANKCVEVRLYPNPFGTRRPAIYPLYWGC